ncbi:MAG: ABC transporter substrate-binding protein [Methanolinea sp.]|jgi:iron complex transport system substrate-binding protein|nr:ABC transporter substrate-binding protein [Methanolinea sp.]
MKLLYSSRREKKRGKKILFFFILLYLLSSLILCGCLDINTQSPQPVQNKSEKGILVPSSLNPSITKSYSIPSQTESIELSGKTGQIEIYTSDGSVVRLPSITNRIIAANSDAAELLIALGASDKIVGVTDTVATDPVLKPFIEKARSIGNWQTPDIEMILELNPDVVIAYGSYRPQNIDKILALNISVLSIDCYHLNTLIRDIHSLAVLTGKESESSQLLAFTQKGIDIAHNRVSTIDQSMKPRVYIEYGDYSVPGKGSGADTLITFSGGLNIAGNDTQSYFKVNPEWIVTQNPDVIIKIVPGNKPWDDYPKIKEDLLKRPGFTNISAVRNNKVYLLNGDYAFGPRAGIGVIAIGKVLHPLRFTDIDPSEMVTEYRQKFLNTVPEDQIIYQ